MKDLGAVLLSCREFLQVPLTIEGFSFSLWDIFLWSIVAGAVIFLIMKWIGD